MVGKCTIFQSHNVTASDAGSSAINEMAMRQSRRSIKILLMRLANVENSEVEADDIMKGPGRLM